MVLWRTRLGEYIFIHYNVAQNSSKYFHLSHCQVLTLFWTLAHSDEVPTEIMDQALNAHVKILDYSCSQERDAQKTIWLDKCVDELKNGDKWALPALKQIREICCLYEPNPNMGHSQRGHHLHYRCDNGVLRVSYIRVHYVSILILYYIQARSNRTFTKRTFGSHTCNK